VIMSRLHLV